MSKEYNTTSHISIQYLKKLKELEIQLNELNIELKSVEEIADQIEKLEKDNRSLVLKYVIGAAVSIVLSYIILPNFFPVFNNPLYSIISAIAAGIVAYMVDSFPNRMNILDLNNSANQKLVNLIEKKLFLLEQKENVKDFLNKLLKDNNLSPNVRKTIEASECFILENSINLDEDKKEKTFVKKKKSH